VTSGSKGLTIKPFCPRDLVETCAFGRYDKVLERGTITCGRKIPTVRFVLPSEENKFA